MILAINLNADQMPIIFWDTAYNNALLFHVENIRTLVSHTDRLRLWLECFTVWASQCVDKSILLILHSFTQNSTSFYPFTYLSFLSGQSPAELGTQKKGPLKADLPIEKAARPKSGRKSSIDSSSGAKKAKTVHGEIPTTPKRSLSFTNISNIRPKSPLHDTDKKGKSNKNIDSCFIREQIYYDWLQRKSSLTKEQIKDMKMKEKEKEEEKLREEQEKKLMVNNLRISGTVLK